MKTGIELITEERDRQIKEEGWTSEHDDAHVKQELAMAAATYAWPLASVDRGAYTCCFREWLWPFGEEWFKPAETPSDRVRDLVKAGALIAAEIDRIERMREIK